MSAGMPPDSAGRFAELRGREQLARLMAACESRMPPCCAARRRATVAAGDNRLISDVRSKPRSEPTQRGLSRLAALSSAVDVTIQRRIRAPPIFAAILVERGAGGMGTRPIFQFARSSCGKAR